MGTKNKISFPRFSSSYLDLKDNVCVLKFPTFCLPGFIVAVPSTHSFIIALSPLPHLSLHESQYDVFP